IYGEHYRCWRPADGVRHSARDGCRDDNAVICSRGSRTLLGRQAGDPNKPARIVEVRMFEGSGKMGFEPARIEVRRGEQVRFVLHNHGEEDHEFILATVAENRKHAEVMKKHPDMEHDDPNGKRILPSGSGELIWKFTKRGEFEFACLIP